METDLALLRAREISHFLDPEAQAPELLHRRDPQTHLPNPEAALPDPRSDPTLIQLLHARAERGELESELAARQTAARRTDSTVAPTGVTSLRVTVEDLGWRAGTCRPANDALRVAAIGSVIDAGVPVVDDDRVSRTFSISLTSLPISTGGCAAFLSVSLRAVPNDDQRAIRSFGRKLLEDGAFVTGPESEFAERVTDQLRRMVGDFVSQMRLANRTR